MSQWIGVSIVRGITRYNGEVVTGIESETLNAVFEHWMERLE
jgi:hypothetical protein